MEQPADLDTVLGWWSLFHLWRPEQLTALLVDAGLAVTAEVRPPVSPLLRPQVLPAARRPG